MWTESGIVTIPNKVFRLCVYNYGAYRNSKAETVEIPRENIDLMKPESHIQFYLKAQDINNTLLHGFELYCEH